MRVWINSILILNLEKWNRLRPNESFKIILKKLVVYHRQRWKEILYYYHIFWKLQVWKSSSSLEWKLHLLVLGRDIKYCEYKVTCCYKNFVKLRSSGRSCSIQKYYIYHILEQQEINEEKIIMIKKIRDCLELHI